MIYSKDLLEGNNIQVGDMSLQNGIQCIKTQYNLN